MSANLSIVNGVAEIFVAGAPAWHNLGVNVSSAQSWKQAVKLAHMQWTVDKYQLEHAGVPVDAWGLFRSDNKAFVSAVGPQYQPIQNEDCFTFVDYLLSSKDGAHYVTAGALGNGDTVWCLAELPEAVRIKGTDDISKQYLMFVDFRQQGRAAITKLTSTRVVCNNTLQMALGEAGDVFKIRHNQDVSVKLDIAKKTILGVQADVGSFNDKMNFLASKMMTRDSMTTILEHLFPNIRTSKVQQSRADDILQQYESNDNDAFPTERGTAYNLLNAVTRYVDHVQSVTLRNQDGTSDLTTVRDVKRAESAMFGSGDRFKTEAVEVIVQEVQNNPVNTKANRLSWVNSFMSTIDIAKTEAQVGASKIMSMMAE